MNTSSGLQELRQELEQLSQRRERLAGRLTAAADRLDSIGEPPGDDLIDDLNSYRERTLLLAEQLGGTRLSADGTAHDRDAARGEITLDDLKRLLTDRECREQSVAALNQVLTLSHVETADFAPLALCQAEARRLIGLAFQASPSGLEPELEAVHNQTHPLNLLLKLCEHGDRLSDSEWVECNDCVTATYGRQLATAIARGRVQRGASPRTEESALNIVTAPVVAVAPPSIPAMLAVVAAATPVATNATADVPVLRRTIVDPPSARVITATPPRVPVRPPSAAWPVPGSDSIFQPSPLEHSVFDERTPPAKMRGMPPIESPISVESVFAPVVSAASAPVRQLAAPAKSGEDATQRSARLPSVVVDLLAENRLALAMHLAQCVEFRSSSISSSSTLPAPVWLLRSLVLAAQVSESRGELARELDDDLRQFRPELLTDDNSERRVALGYFLRAAALPAALISGANSSTSILRAFKIAPGCSQLYNYCSRIALYGDRLDGQVVEMFRSPLAAGDESNIESVAIAAEQWLQDTAQKAVNYGRTSPLFLHAHWTLTASTSIRHSEATQVWCKWQEVLLFASRLLRPVIEDDTGERNSVRQEITRLTTLLRTDATENGPRTGTSSAVDAAVRGNNTMNGEMQAVLHKALDFASRWLRLSGLGSAQTAAPLPPDAFELREEVLRRSAGVIHELDEQSHLATSPLIRAAIACCRRSVERIHGLFEGRLSVPLQELELRHALHAELLKIPGLELNDQWEPEAEPATLERELFDHLERGDTSWAYAYDVHALHGDHVATGRLLELNVWTSDAKRGALRVQRAAQINDHRATLAREIDEVSHELAMAANAGQLEEADGTTFAQRLDRLQRDLPKQLNFGSYRWQLDQMRSALQRRRARPAAMPLLPPPLPVWSPAAAEPVRGLRGTTTNTRGDDAAGREALAFTTDIFSRG